MPNRVLGQANDGYNDATAGDGDQQWHQRHQSCKPGRRILNGGSCCWMHPGSAGDFERISLSSPCDRPEAQCHAVNFKAIRAADVDRLLLMSKLI